MKNIWLFIYLVKIQTAPVHHKTKKFGMHGDKRELL